jgi:hypothetical protein
MGKGVFGDGSSRETGVVVRATVESFGPMGDTELTVTMKWPAGINGVQRIETPEESSPGPDDGEPDSDGALKATAKRKPQPES